MQPPLPGADFDKETNPHYNYFRYYEPETGRYISPDPIGLAGGVNVLGYVLQNPPKWIDPLNLASLVTDMTAGLSDPSMMEHEKFNRARTNLFSIRY
ncbi:RHS repeat-associated core domain-containing protein [Nitrosomonas sp.]|uniref:RHS repeat domain-containing protein n=1 Tax=Nitrosomonas sp. TaxID=42353 RepID=UPI00344249A2